MATVNNLVNSLSVTPNSFSAMIMCPVEETGKNSVRPSTIAIIIDWITSITCFQIRLYSSFWFSENSEDFEYKTPKYQNRRNRNACSAINLVGSKLIRVITLTAGHQDKANSHDNNSPKHPEVVLFFKNGI